MTLVYYIKQFPFQGEFRVCAEKVGQNVGKDRLICKSKL